MSQQSTGTVLDAIIEGVRADLAERREHVGLDELRRAAAQRPPALDAESALRGPSTDAVQVIA